MAALKVGDMAPDFEVPAATGEEKHTLKLSDYRGKKNVVLAFHPLDWTPVCSSQSQVYESDKKKFEALDTVVVGMSVDSVFSHVAWQKHEIGMLTYPMGSDFHPHGEVASRYGIMRTQPPLGINERAVFVIDKQGRIAFAQVYELGELPDNEDVFQVLHKLA